MRVVQALHWLRDVLVRDGESEQIQRKLAKLFEDPVVGPPLKADLAAGITALPTWMRVFLKPLMETDPNHRRQHSDDVHAAADQNRPRHQRAGDDHHDTVGASPLKPRTSKRTTNKAAKA
jgi:hypothetical protein